MKLSALPYQFIKPFSLKDDTNMAQLDDTMRKKMNKIRNNLRVIFLKIKNVEEIFPKLPSYHIIAQILSFVGYSQEVAFLLTMLSIKTQMYMMQQAG